MSSYAIMHDDKHTKRERSVSRPVPRSSACNSRQSTLNRSERDSTGEELGGSGSPKSISYTHALLYRVLMQVDGVLEMVLSCPSIISASRPCLEADSRVLH